MTTIETKHVDSTRTAGSSPTTDESVGGLLSRLGEDVSGLVSTEVSLAKTELRESIDDAKAGAASFGIGAVVLFVGLLVLIMGLSLWLASVAGLPPYAGYLIVGLVVTVIGGVLLMTAKSKLATDNLALNRTAESLRKDQRTVGEKI